MEGYLSDWETLFVKASYRNCGVTMRRPEAWTAAKSQDVVKHTQDVLSLFRGRIIINLRCRFPSRMGYNVIRDRTVVVRRTAVKATTVQVDCISRRRRKRATACRGWLWRTKLQR